LKIKTVKIKMVSRSDINKLYNLPFMDLLYKSQKIHRGLHKNNEVQISKLRSIKTGLCPEDCKYCSQSAHYTTNIETEKLINVEMIVNEAKAAKSSGATRFCLSAAWKRPPKKQFPRVIEMIKEVKSLGMESCVTLGSLSDEQAFELNEVGLDYYNHNLDTSREFYPEITSTRTYQERIDTLDKVGKLGIKTCSGGIIGLGEKREDRVGLIYELSCLKYPPTSIPINKFMPIKGTPLGDSIPEFDNFEFIKTIAVVRICFPKSKIRLTAGRTSMSDEMQALCFMAGSNSIFIGNKLLTAANPDMDSDFSLLDKLDLKAEKTNMCMEDNI
jgi:biotin synthase